jgi:hypothetical protein
METKEPITHKASRPKALPPSREGLEIEKGVSFNQLNEYQLNYFVKKQLITRILPLYVGCRG